MKTILKKRYTQIGFLLFAFCILGIVLGTFSAWIPYSITLMVSVAVLGVLVLWSIRVFAKMTHGTRKAFQNSSRAEVALVKSLHTETLREIASVKKELHSLPRGSNADHAAPLALHAFGNTLGKSGQFFGIGPDYEYAQRIQNDVSGFETFALRSKSLRIRDAFALNATRMQFNYVSLMRVLNSGRAGYTPGIMESVAGNWNKDSLLALGRLVANQRAVVTDSHDAISIFWTVEKTWGAEALGKTAHYLYVEALQDLNFSKEANAKLKEFRLNTRNPIQSQLVKSNLINGKMNDQSDEDWIKWSHAVNRVFANEMIAPISISCGLGAPIDRIIVNQEVTQGTGPKVSVIVPTFNGGQYVRTAIDSLLSQSWANLEIIIVDDCSDVEHFDILRNVASGDDRIKLLQQPSNSGAYAARNAGLAASTGEFVTVHDDDDWSHPQKIEIQVNHLIVNPLMHANMSRHARVTPGMRFVRINNNPSFSQPNFSSMLVRRELFDEIGPWDTVNRSGDSEFRDRIHAFTRTTVEVVGEAPLSFTRTRPDSLTAGEMSRGYVDPARRFYMESYLAWHNRVVGGLDVSSNIKSRPFAIPLNMRPSMRGKYFGKYDVVYATDFRFPGGTTSLTIREISVARASGLRVGIVQLDSPMNKPSTPMSPLVIELISNSTAELLSLTDKADVDLLIVRHPTVVQFADKIESNLKPRRLLMIVNNTPILRGGRGSAFDMAECSSTLERIFGIDCEIVPESGVTRRMCEKLVGKDLLADFDWLGFVVQNDVVSRKVHNELPLVGRHSRDHLVKWPGKKADLYGAYVQPDVFRTRILGGADSIKALLNPAAHDSVEVLPFGAMAPSEFLKELDFWVYFHNDSYAESFGMAPAEAMAAGLVVILPHYMKSTFGYGAIYCTPSEVSATVKQFWVDREAYETQSKAGLQFVEDHLSEKAYRARLLHTIPGEILVAS